MNIVILAAGDKGVIVNNDIKPRPLLQLQSGESILSNLLNKIDTHLKDKHRIFLAINKSKLWSKENLSSIDRRIQIIWIKNAINSNNSYTVLEVLNYLKQDSQVTMFIDGDIVIPEIVLKSIINSRSSITMLTRKKITYNENGIDLFFSNSLLTGIASKKYNLTHNTKQSDRRFSGVLKTKAHILSRLREILNTHEFNSYVEALNFLIAEEQVEIIDTDYLKNVNDQSLIGGSFAKLKIMKIVRKEVDSQGLEKLNNEIQWLTQLPLDLKKYFPEIIRYEVNENNAFYEMKYYEFPNLRDIIYKQENSPDDIALFIEKLLFWINDNLYSRVLGNADLNWIIEKHFKRFFERISIIEQNSNRLKQIISFERIEINNKEYQNLPYLMRDLIQMPDLYKIISPKNLSMIHGDLHPQNILVESMTDFRFILADPRGELEGSDFYYDLGKIWHSFNGKYDLLHTGSFDMKQSGDSFLIQFQDRSIVEAYDEVLKKLIPRLPIIFNTLSDKDFFLKIRLNEVFHFASVSLFHLDNANDEKATAMYIVGVMLINDFFDEFKIRERFKVDEKFHDINNKSEYERYLGLNKYEKN